MQQRVIAGHVVGHSKRQIAREEGIDPKTVGRILGQKEVVQWIAKYRQRLLSLVPTAIEVYEDALLSDDEQIRVAVATKLVEGLQVIPRGHGQIGDMAALASPEERRDGDRVWIGKIVDATVTKSGTHAIKYPKEWDQLKPEPEAEISAQRKPVSEEKNSETAGNPEEKKAS